jgi:outer membrane protein
VKSSVPRLIAAPILVGLALSSLPASAQQAGDNVIQIGFFSVDTLDKSTPLHTDLRPSTLATLAGIQPSFDSPGTAVSVSSANTLALTSAHFFTDNIAIKFEGGLPATFDLTGRGTVMPTGVTGNLIQVNLGDPAINPIASAKQWSPALIAQYFFFAPDAVVRPFLGVGFTYTWFTEVSTSQGFQDSLNNNFGSVLALAAGKSGPTHVTSNASASFAAAYSAGIAFRVTEHWGVSGGIGYSTLKTNAKIEIKAADDTVLSTSTTKISLNPLVYSLLFNYRFKL